MIFFIQSVDVQVLQALYALRDPYWVSVNMYVSWFGEWYILFAASLLLAGWLALRDKFALAQGILLSLVTSGIMTLILKAFVARPRPPQEFQAVTETWYSFPSAHAAVSLALYGFLAFLIWNSGLSAARKKLGIAVIAVLVLAIGFSRLYLGVHYLSDVAGGYLVGVASLLLGVWSTRILERAPTPTTRL